MTVLRLPTFYMHYIQYIVHTVHYISYIKYDSIGIQCAINDQLYAEK